MATTLTINDVRSDTWRRVEAILNERIAAHRLENDTPLDETKTTRLRGRIAEAKELLALAEGVRAQAKRRDADPDGPPSHYSPSNGNSY